LEEDWGLYWGALLGGLAGGISANLADKQNLDNAVEIAAQRRFDQYGMELVKRFSNIEWDVRLMKQDISTLSVGNDSTSIICRTKDNQTIEFIVNKIGDSEIALLSTYLTPDMVTKPVADPFLLGVNMPYPAPEALLNSFRNGQVLGKEDDNAIGNSEMYMANFYVFLREIDKKDISHVCQNIRSCPDSKIAQACARIAREHIKEKIKFRNNKAAYIFTPFFIFMLVENTVDRLNDPVINWGQLLGGDAFALVFIALGLLLIFGSLLFGSSKKARIILHHLTQ